ncbi:MAG: hypothetical protein K2O65_12990, partial [Lachnospiraceae bacterium]|nr:hypothetical protein [Lachnospiraceae bacterium]
MSKQAKRFFQKGLCGILSAAMILTGSIIPDISVLAAQTALEDTTENTDADGLVNKISPEQNNDVIQNPDAGNGDANETGSNTGNGGSGNENENIPKELEKDADDGDNGDLSDEVADQN